jgi:hypothetical protein
MALAIRSLNATDAGVNDSCRDEGAMEGELLLWIEWFVQRLVLQQPVLSQCANPVNCGCSGCPLNEPFHPMGRLAMDCWLKSFWEVVDRFRLQLVVDYLEIPYPWLNDQLIMQLAICLGFSVDEFDSINRCRLACCCIFLSDLASANGKFLDPTRVLEGVNYSQSSTYSFLQEHPSDVDWEVWNQFWAQYCMTNGANGCTNPTVNGSGIIIWLKTLWCSVPWQRVGCIICASKTSPRVVLDATTCLREQGYSQDTTWMVFFQRLYGLLTIVCNSYLQDTLNEW